MSRLRVALVVIAVLCSATTTLVVARPTAAQARGMGSQPLDDVRFWAAQRARCGLGAEQLAAMMLAVVYPEAGTSGEQSPSPMTLSRYDTQPGLYAFGSKTTPWQRAFWHPAAGLWAMDSAGGWNLTAVGTISTWTAAEQVASTMADRWCANRSRSYVWALWYACATGGICEAIYNEIFDGTHLRNLTSLPEVTRDGGMEARTCTVAGAPVICWYVDPARAQGSKWWVAPGAGTSPITAPFYVVSQGGREVRYWLAQDTGYPLSIKADKPVTANARTSLSWATTSELCDTTAARGDCGTGARVANTPWGPRTETPFGSLDVANANVASIDVNGWAIDPDTNDPLDVHVYVDGQIVGVTRADAARPDVAAAVPGYGAQHGFGARFGPVGGGTHQVCAYAINAGPFGSQNPNLGCRSVTVAASPVGTFDGWITSSPGIHVSGWAVDADAATSPVGVHVYVDGGFAGQATASGSRPDLAGVYPWVGSAHGYAVEVNAPPGAHSVCTYGINVGSGTNSALGCKSIVVPDRAPFGSFDALTRVSDGAVRVTGWAMDPDLVYPIDVHVYVNGVFAAALAADGSRPDLAAVFPLFGPYHGFDVTVAAPAGATQVCVYGINWGPGWGNPQLGCKVIG